MSGSIGFALCIYGVLVLASLVQAQNNRGTPGVDYPNYHSVPETSFSCSEQKFIPGFYADLETKCQAFHFCFQDRHESFLCPTGTIFNQAILTCDNWFNSNCSLSPLFYDVNVGPIMESAGRKLPMLLKLRSRSPNKTPKPETLVPEKELLSSEIQSQNAEGGGNEVADSSSTSESIDVKAGAINEPVDSNNQISDISDNEQMVNDHGLDMPEENESVDELNEEMDKLVYDPVTDDYFSDGSPYELDWQDSTSDDFKSFYNRGGDYVLHGTRSSSAFNDYSEDGMASLMGNLNAARHVDPAAFSKRMQVAHSRRVRRKPMYVMVPDMYEVDDQEHVLSDEPQSSASLGGESTTELPVEETTRAEPFPRPTRIPPHLLELNTPTPMSTEEFGAAIFSELVEPYLPDDYGTIIASTYEQPQDSNTSVLSEQVEPQGGIEDTQGDDQSVYVEVVPGQTSYESYVSEYGKGEINLESTYEHRPESDTQYETENAGKTDSDTYVVIPDETEGESDQAVLYQMDGNSQDIADYGQYEDAYNYDSNAYFPESYEVDPLSQIHYVRSIPKTWSDRERTYDTRNSEVHYVPAFSYANDGAYAREDIDFDNFIPSMARMTYRRLMNERLRRYYNQLGRQQDEASQSDSSYDSENPYSYAGMYNPYSEDGQMQYDESLYSESYSEPRDADWTEQNQATEMPGVFEVTDSPLPLPVTDADLDLASEYFRQNEVSETEPGENIEQNEEVYYVFDEEGNSEGSLTEEIESDKSILDSERQNFQSLEGRLNGSSHASVLHDNVSLNANGAPDGSKMTNEFSFNSLLASAKDSTESDSTSHKAKDSKHFDTSARVSDSFAAKSAAGPMFGRIDTSHSTGSSSKSEELGLSSDSRYLNNIAFQDSMDFGPYGFNANMGQQYSMLESLQPGQTRTMFSERTGESDQSRLSKLSAFQEKMRSMKQGKFGAFKKYIGSSKD